MTSSGARWLENAVNADIKDQNGAFANLAAPDADVVLCATDAGRDARIEKTRQLACSAALSH
jgi:hypothetical protein